MTTLYEHVFSLADQDCTCTINVEKDTEKGARYRTDRCDRCKALEAIRRLTKAALDTEEKRSYFDNYDHGGEVWEDLREEFLPEEDATTQSNGDSGG